MSEWKKKNLESPCPPGQRGGEAEFAERKIVIYFISVEKCSVFSFLFIFFLAFGLHDKWVLKSGAIEEGPRGATKKIAKKDAWKYISLLMPLFILPNLLPVPHVEPSSSLMRAINWRERCWRKNHAPEKNSVACRWGWKTTAKQWRRRPNEVTFITLFLLRKEEKLTVFKSKKVSKKFPEKNNSEEKQKWTKTNRNPEIRPRGHWSSGAAPDQPGQVSRWACSSWWHST